MGTQAITGFVNDLNLVNVDIPKNGDSNGEFAKAFENASNNEDLKALSKRNVNVVEELKTDDSDQAKSNYLKETGSKSFDNKVESKTNKPVNTTNASNTASNKTSDVELEEIEAVSEVISAYLEVFGISPEDFQNFLTENDISVSDLLDVSKVQDIVMQFNGITDSVEILTDDALFDSIKDIEDLVSTFDQISDNLDENDLNEAFANLKNLAETTESSKSEIVNHKVVGAEVIEPEEIEIKELATPSVSPESQSSKKETKEDRGNDTENHTLSNQNIATDTNNNVHSTQGTEQTSFSTNAQQIYDQIGEYVRNLSTENINEIEMKLQPETLGTLHIRITQSEGLMKAEFLTANENVRAAIEAQLIQLKEDFDRSGIRVDEVEVRVATNEFNEATQQDSRDEENEAASRQSNVRRINLTNGIDLDEIEDYEEEEKITVEMMTANGNSLDYKA